MLYYGSKVEINATTASDRCKAYTGLSRIALLLDARPACPRREIAKEIGNRPVGGGLVVVGHDAVAGLPMVVGQGFQRIDPSPPRPETSSHRGHPTSISKPY